MDSIKSNVETYRKENGLPADALVPADAVTSSGSGLDPHISIRNADLQIPRVAKERGLGEDVVRAEVAKATDRPLLGFIGGDPGVNVLKLNLALDGLANVKKQPLLDPIGTRVSRPPVQSLVGQACLLI